MAKVEIYWRDGCPFCVKAFELLKVKDVDFIEYNIWDDTSKKDELEIRKPNFKTVPQIFINDKSIGGCSELYQLEENGKLDDLLK